MFDPASNSDQDFINWIQEQRQPLAVLSSRKEVETPMNIDDAELEAALNEVERTGAELFEALDAIE